MTFQIKRRDTSPSIEAVLQVEDGTPVNITGATVRFHMQNTVNAEVVIDAPATIVTPLAGLVRYDWQGDDTASAGFFAVEWEVTYADGSIETFPNGGNAYINITRDIA